MDGLILGTRKRKVVDDSDEALLTPKKARISHATPSTVRTVPSTPATSTRSYVNSINATPSRSGLPVAPSTPLIKGDLPQHLARLLNIYSSLEKSMSFALATGQKAPDPENGRVPAVLNHLGIAERVTGSIRMDADDLRRLCWIWEWDPDAEHEGPLTQETKPVLSEPTTRTHVHSDASMRSVDSAEEVGDEDDNPFLVKHTHVRGKAQGDNPFIGGSESETPKDWIRGGSGFIITPALHVQKNTATGTSKREPAYGIGIEVDWAHEDVSGGRVGGMGAVSRWVTAGETRKPAFKEKLERWVEVHSSPASALPTPAPSAIKSKIVGVIPPEANSSIPVIPFADLPALSRPVKSKPFIGLPVLSLPKPFRAGSLPTTTPSPVKTTLSNKDNPSPPKKDAKGFMIPFPVEPGLRPVTPSGNHAPSTFLPRSGGIRTPSFGRAAAAKIASETTPCSREEKIVSSNGRVTPTLSLKKPIDLISRTPTHRKGNNSGPSSGSGANSMYTPNTGAPEPETPTSARRRALYERIRTKSESEVSDKKLVAVTASVRRPRSDANKLRSASVTKLITPEELRRRCILGRLHSVAEAVWMLFSSPANSSLTSAGRKRRAIEQSEVVRAVVKSANSPISDAEAVESLEMLCELCPFFLRRKIIDGEGWLEMPATTGAALTSPGAALSASPGGGSTGPRYMDGLPSVMGTPGKVRASEEEFLTRSPRRIKKEEGGLRQVRDIIRRELEVDGDEDSC